MGVFSPFTNDKTLIGFRNWALGGTSAGRRNTVFPKHRYWRLRTGANNGDFNLLIAEIQLREVIGGPSITSGKTVTQSNFNIGGQEGSKAFDNNNTTFWAQGTKVNNSGQWVRVDLVEPKSVVEFAILEAGTPAQALNLFWLEGSDDNITWNIYSRVANQTGWVNGELRTYSNGASNLLPNGDNSVGAARYWRININSNNGSTNAIITALDWLDNLNNSLTLYGNISANRTNSPSTGLTQAPATLLDGLSSTFWASVTNQVAGSTITYDFLVPTLPRKLSITARADMNVPSTAIKDWKIESSTDNITWTTIATITNQTNWTQGETRIYEF